MDIDMKRIPVRRAAQPNILASFPPGFDPRPQQVEALELSQKAFDDGARIVLVEMPTGGGKSYVSQTHARAVREAGGRSHVLTAQKILQDQYEKDFASPEMELIKGRNAYPCNHKDAKPEDTCASAPCTRMGKSFLPSCAAASANLVTSLAANPNEIMCPYWRQLTLAARSPITLFNFSSFLYQQRIGRFGQRDLMIIDEAHNCESQLLGFVSLSLNERALEPLDEALPHGLTSAGAVADWIRRARLLEKATAGAEDENAPAIEREAFERLAAKLEVFIEYLDRTEWVVEETPAKGGLTRGLLCRPVYAMDFADDLLFRRGKRVLGMSATILSKELWAQGLGIPPSEVALIQLGSDFPIANRPIRREFLGNMNYANKERTLPRLVAWVRDTLLPQHKGERGIIHAHSFDIAKAIVAGANSPRLLLHQAGQDKRDVLAQHAQRPDSVIVAPAFHEGVDLKDDLSRFQVLAKAPYPNMGDAVVSRRLKGPGGDAWYLWSTILKVVQSYGRSVRSKDDHAVTYLTDTGFGGLLGRAGRLLPRWFKEAVV